MESIITKKVVYALRSLYYLEVVKENQMTSVQEIADAVSVPKRFLEQLYLKLRKAGLLVSVRGACGGYQLARPLTEISYRQLLEALNDGRREACEGVDDVYGEVAFVHAIQERMEELTLGLLLGLLISPAMRLKADTGKAGAYVYQI